MNPSMNTLDELLTGDGWIITKTTNGKTNIASCDPNEINPFDVTRDNWVTLHESAYLEQNKENVEEPQIEFKPQFQQTRLKNIEKRVGLYLIRDLLNFKKLNSFTKSFEADNLPLTRVMICARIVSYQPKSNVYRLILDDGTSSILCIVQIKDDNTRLQDSDCEEGISEGIETLYCKSQDTKNNNVLWAIKKLSLQGKKIMEDSTVNFNQMSLGRPVRIIGTLREFCGTTFIYSYNFRWVSEKYFVNFLSYIVYSYEYKENYMLK